MYISILGRQPALGAAELERLYGNSVRWFSPQSVVVDSSEFDFERLGGSQKAGRVVLDIPRGDWRAASMKIVHHYVAALANVDYKVTLGISVYGFDVATRDIQKTGLILKQKLRDKGVSLRLVPNAEPALNTAVSHHNKLGLSPNKIEFLIVRGKNGSIIVAESVGAQNITALAARDQARPYTDAFVGMLPPKLASIMINMTGVSPYSHKASESTEHSERHLQPEHQATTIDLTSGAKRLKNETSTSEIVPPTLLDPFCGTGVILQEAQLLGFNTYGSDLSEKMVDYSTKNIKWLGQSYNLRGTSVVEYGDAMTHTWRKPIDSVACEAYLGQPFSAPPSPAKLTEVRGNCNHIISEFLRNISHQITPGTPLCVAVPAWRDVNGRFTHLPLIGKLDELGFERHRFELVADSELLYYRETQVVARELLVLTRRYILIRKIIPLPP